MKPITPLSTKGRRLLEVIVDFIAAHPVVPGKPETYPNYALLYRKLVLSVSLKIVRVGRMLQGKGLNDLNEWTKANVEIPKVTGLIVDKNKKLPGGGFFSSYNKKPGLDDGWWHEEVRKALAFNWSPYIGSQKPNSPTIPADDLDRDELAPRIKLEISRIIRDTKIVREVKALHQHKCQLCGNRLELTPGTYYSEAHHLKPLGKPHGGSDKKSNIVCVCPNCHVKLDYHAIRLLPGMLRVKPGHSIAQCYIDHHNSCCI